MSTRNLIDNIKKGDAQKSNNVFNSIMHDKILNALDTHKQEVASKMYGASNNDTPVAEEPAVETPEEETATDANV
jgi:hypothetical protein|tara:strand:+ start:239 stop:463 length:225 start_codon:yes stop_codon:yes gene_type:complete